MASLRNRAELELEQRIACTRMSILFSGCHHKKDRKEDTTK